MRVFAVQSRSFPQAFPQLILLQRLARTARDASSQESTFATVTVCSSSGAFTRIVTRVPGARGISARTPCRNAATLLPRLRRDSQPADVVIMSREGLNDLIAEGRIQAGRIPTSLRHRWDYQIGPELSTRTLAPSKLSNGRCSTQNRLRFRVVQLGLG